MKRLLALALPAALLVGFSGFLRADDSAPPSAGPAAIIDFQSANTYLWYVEHTAEIAKDSEASGIAAVLQVGDLYKGKDPQQEIDFLNKMLFETKSRAVQRTIRMELAGIFKSQGQPDRALQQLQMIIDDAHE